MKQLSTVRVRVLALIGLLVGSAVAASPQGLIADYERAGAGPFAAADGERAWRAEHRPPGAGSKRACTSCHGTDLRRAGRHATTGKAIEPMALSANPQRLADPVKTERWFQRNCRWTWGRECTPQEKGDFVRLMQGL